MTENRDVMQEAIDLWGVPSQIDMLQEELIELAQAISKLRRNGFTEDNIANVIDEIADVEIMCEQARKIFGSESIDVRKKFKLERLANRIDSTF
jgi:NTP pyrophosphatase (non-canonical NTP hydrolase)